MRQYEIYLIEEEFASHYFGRESKIYQLFLEYYQISTVKKKLLQKQIEFITKPIPSFTIHQYLETILQRRQDYKRNHNIHCIRLTGGRSYAKLIINKQYITLKANGTYEAETTFFEILRKYNRCFIAMDYDHNRYGWLNPIKERNFV